MLRERFIEQLKIPLIDIIIRDIESQIRIKKNQEIKRIITNRLSKQRGSNENMRIISLNLF